MVEERREEDRAEKENQDEESNIQDSQTEQQRRDRRPLEGEQTDSESETDVGGEAEGESGGTEQQSGGV